MTVQNMHNALTPGTAGEIFLYQDSRDAGSVYRFVVTLTMHIHKRYLEQAIEDLMPRFPSFSVGLERSGESLRLVPLENEVPVFECGCDLVSDGLPLIGGPELGGYLFRVSYSGKTLLFDWHLSLCDGKGMFEFVKAAVFRYMQISGYPVSNDGTVKEADDASNSIEGMDPYERLDDIPASRPVWYMDAKAFNASHGGTGSGGSVHVQQIRIPLARVKGQTRDYLSAPESFLSPLFSHTLYEFYAADMAQGEYIVSGIKENLRPHFPTASLRTYFSPVTLTYNRKLTDYPFGTILMSQKKLLDAQLKQDALAYSAKCLMRMADSVCDGDVPFGEKLVRAGRCLDTSPSAATFSICCMGNMAMPESLQQYLSEFYLIVPSGNYASSLSVVNFKGEMVVTLADRASDRTVAERFVGLLRQHDIPAFISDEFCFTQLEYIPNKIS